MFHPRTTSKRLTYSLTKPPGFPSKCRSLSGKDRRDERDGTPTLDSQKRSRDNLSFEGCGPVRTQNGWRQKDYLFYESRTLTSTWRNIERDPRFASRKTRLLSLTTVDVWVSKLSRSPCPDTGTTESKGPLTPDPSTTGTSREGRSVITCNKDLV